MYLFLKNIANVIFNDGTFNTFPFRYPPRMPAITTDFLHHSGDPNQGSKAKTGKKKAIRTGKEGKKKKLPLSIDDIFVYIENLQINYYN